MSSSSQLAVRLLRRECCSLLASRSFSSSSSAAAGAITEAFDSAGAAADPLAAVTADFTSATAATAGGGVASTDPGAVLGAAMAAVDGLHATTGLPWWATISAVGVAVRVAMFPVSLQGMKASAALMPLLRQARDEAAASMRQQLNAAAPAAPQQQQEEAERHNGSKQQRWQRKQEQAAAAAAAAQQQQQRRQQQAGGGQPAQPPRPPLGPSTRQILSRFHLLRQASGAPHPAWVLASPLIQLPVFITAMAAIRSMSLNGWPGFSSGGTAWFPDLTQPAMDLATWTAPMGMAGVVLPVGIVMCMLANIDAAFTVPAGSRQQASVTAWVMGGLRLLLEWMMVPLFAIALQLPQGALCYWAASSSLALLQNSALKQAAVRRAVGLPTGTQQGQQQQGQQAAELDASAPRPAAEAAAAAAAAVAAGAAGPLPMGAGVDPSLRTFLLTTSDQATLFDKAAELRAEGRAGAASTVLRRLLQLYPGQPNALYALGQVHAALKDWPLSEQCYLQAAHSQQLDSQSRARSWFGAAVAMHMQQEHDTAIHTFGKAAQAAQTDDLRVRCWVSQAALHRKLGQLEEAAALLKRAAKAEPSVDKAYLQPLLAQMAGQEAEQQQQQEGQQGGQLERELEGEEQGIAQQKLQREEAEAAQAGRGSGK